LSIGHARPARYHALSPRNNIHLPEQLPRTVETMAPIELGSHGDVQGDIWSKGFPKYHEAYYFFVIKDAVLFRTALAKLATDPSDQILTAGNKEKRLPLISTLDKVLADQAYISANGAGGGWKPEKDRIPVSNALIAFTITGLANVSARICIGRVA